MPFQYMGHFVIGLVLVSALAMGVFPAIGAVQDSLQDSAQTDIKDAQGDVIVDGDAWMESAENTVVKDVPNLYLLILAGIAVYATARYANIRRGPGGGF